MRALVMLVFATLLTITLPVAAAEPQCLQVYPWSELCQGDVDGFLEGMGIGIVEPQCLQVYPWSELCQGDVAGFLHGMGIDLSLDPRGPPVECLQVYPWSELCQGDVGSFLCYYGVCARP